MMRAGLLLAATVGCRRIAFDASADAPAAACEDFLCDRFESSSLGERLDARSRRNG